MLSDGIDESRVMPSDGGSSPPSVGGNPGSATMAELDALLARAATEVQRGMDEGVARIGRYTLVTAVGEGGFGTVWLASQEEPVRRLVALKLLRRDPNSRMVLARFQNERQTLARMDHPNVATVLDAGVTDDGRPWFVMPFIDGLPINVLCDEQRLRPRQRVQLFAAVCDGVQHAHQKGVIHRDLKPGNILVTRDTERPVPKVIDFGVAKACDPSDAASLRTAEGQRLGTPQYMPPEQWMHGAGIADARSDVYALGAVLGELLVGGPPTRLPRTPLEVPEVVPPLAWLAEVGARDPAVVAATAAARGMTVDELTEAVRGDLDAIVRRATAAHPDDRYATAAALADDLRRWLEGRAVAARLLGPSERALRWVRRHRVAASLAAVAAVALVTVLVVWTTSVAESRRERELTDVAQRQSERTFDLARSMIEDMVQQLRTSNDVMAGKATFQRVDRMLDQVAADDPLAAGRLAAIVVKGHQEAWEHSSAYALARRSLDRVLAVDPEGRSEAYRELVPEVYLMSLKYDRPAAARIGPDVFETLASEGRLFSPEGRTLFIGSLTECQPWPFFREGAPVELRLAASQWYASSIPDPIESACVNAQSRIFSYIRGDHLPGRATEMFAALEYLRAHRAPDDHGLILAEVQVSIMMDIDGLGSQHSLQGMMLHCARAAAAFGEGSSRTVNARWNLAYSCVNQGFVKDGYDAYIDHLWPEYRRQVATDGLRAWYLAYFAPVAFMVADYDTAYACALTQLADEIDAGGPATSGVCQLSARVLAGVLALRGDEAGAQEVERRFKVQRVPECMEQW
jgi:serine/threonine protein kinase